MRHFKLGLTLLFFSLFAAISKGQLVTVPRLEEPSGKYAVGREAFHWIDEHRVDSLSDDHHAHRELMVYVWYPAVPDLDGAEQMDMYIFMCYGESMKDTRLIALIEPGQMRALKAAARREKVSLAEIVRRAISSYLKVK